MKRLYDLGIIFVVTCIAIGAGTTLARRRAVPERGVGTAESSASPGGVRLRIKQMARDVAEGGANQQQGLERFQKVAEKLVSSMKKAQFDKQDFSDGWVEKLAPDANFSQAVLTLYKPVLDRYGKPKRLGRGRTEGPGRAKFGVFFPAGVLLLHISLDKNDKIVEWTMAPRGQEPAGQAPGVGVGVSAADENGVDANETGEFQGKMKRLEIQAKQEQRQWLEENKSKLELYNTVGRVAVAELKFIRSVAAGEGADKTVAAINAVLLQRRRRAAATTEKLNEQVRAERMKQAEQRRSRRTAPATRDRGRQRDSRRSRDNRPRRTAPGKY